jgi:hypothetical protein
MAQPNSKHNGPKISLFPFFSLDNGTGRERKRAKEESEQRAQPRYCEGMTDLTVTLFTAERVAQITTPQATQEKMYPALV